MTAALLRVVAALVGGPALLSGSGVARAACFLLFAVVYRPMLLQERTT